MDTKIEYNERIDRLGMALRDLDADDRIRYQIPDEPDQEYAVLVDNATVRFNLSTERVTSLKEYFLKSIKKRLVYNEFYPLREINLKIKPGESWGIIGVNGSGKSTLLKLICQILKPYRGKVTINGTIAPLIELGAGMDNELSGRKNIYLNGAILGLSYKYIKEHYDEIVDFSELGNFVEVPLKNYSSGMRARLGFSVATMVRPQILIVDEVLAVGDYAFQQKCMKRMYEMVSGGTTVLFVSHSEASVKKICDHALWLDHGRCVMQGEVDEVCDAYKRHFGHL